MKLPYVLYIALMCNLDNLHVETTNQYRAAVYEHAVIYPPDKTMVHTREDALKWMTKNLQIYKKQAMKASAMRASIIVFPEYGLYGLNWTYKGIQPYLEYIPDVKATKWNPCRDPSMYLNTEVQRNLSCIAKEAEIYVVANIGAREPCDKTEHDCPSDMHYQFSANVVYGPNGDFIAKYFKYNLYPMESYFDKPRKPDFTTFDTAFGRFGTFTSADILFHDPAVHLIKTLNITNIVYPTAWQDDLPLKAAVEFQSAFAEGMSINLLAANLHLPDTGYYGSGLYWPIGASFNASYYYNGESKSSGHLIVDDMIPYLISQKSQKFLPRLTPSAGLERDHFVQVSYSGRPVVENILFVNDFRDNVNEDDVVEITIDNDVYNAIILRQPSGQLEVCQGKLCCYIHYGGEFNRDELYAIGAFDGVHSSNGAYYLQACVFIKCANRSKESCGVPTTTSSSYLSGLLLSGNFTTEYVYPGVFTKQREAPGLVPAKWYYDWSYIILTDPRTYGGPLSVSLLARDFSRDPK